MPNGKAIKKITDIFSMNQDESFLNAAKNYTYAAVIEEVNNALANSVAPPDVIYIGVGVGDPPDAYPGTNPTNSSKIPNKLYDSQCYPAFLDNYTRPLCICINSSLNINGKPFKDKVKVISEGFPLGNTSDIDLAKLQNKISMPVVVLNAVSQNDYPGIANLAWNLGRLSMSGATTGATYLKSYAMMNSGSVNGYYQFLGKNLAIQGSISLDLTDKDLLEKIKADLT